MRKEWKYEGRKYIIYDDREGNLYLNCHLCDCSDIYDNIDHPNGKIVRQTKRKAKELLEMIEGDIAREKQRKAKLIEEAEKTRISNERFYMFLNGAFFFVFASSVTICILYLIYQIWWFFIGDWAFNGPFAFDISAEDIILKSVLFFIALIVIVEEVVRRIRNGHF